MDRISYLCAALLLSFTPCPAQTTAPSKAATPLPRRNTGDPPPNGFTRAIPLWPRAAPMATGSAPRDIPHLFFYPPTSPGVGSTVILLPGGAYTHVLMEKEGGFEARWLAAHGVAAFVLQYRLAPRYRLPVPMLDGARAVRYVRSHADEFGIDPARIGVWGFSAGGHLAGYLATALDARAPASPDPVERVSAHPDFAIFSYGRLSVDPSAPLPASMKALLGAHPSPQILSAMSIASRVTPYTSPSLIYSTSADQTVSPLTATDYYDALKRVGVPAELHIFELGGHGTGMGIGLNGPPELEVWPLLVEHWMQQHGWMAPAPPGR